MLVTLEQKPVAKRNAGPGVIRIGWWTVVMAETEHTTAVHEIASQNRPAVRAPGAVHPAASPVHSAFPLASVRMRSGTVTVVGPPLQLL